MNDRTGDRAMRNDAQDGPPGQSGMRPADGGEGWAVIRGRAPEVLVGVLGGMGPAATLDFLDKLIAATPAERDQDHIPVTVWSNPRIPNRNRALLEPGSPSPGPDLQYGVRQLEAQGASFIAIACNTAHHWHAEMQAAVSIPILHIADIAVAALREAGHLPGTAVGLMCSDGTLASGYYDTRLAEAGFAVIRPTDDMQRRMMTAIYAVKVADLTLAGRLSRELAKEFAAAGAGVLLLACTELPVALANDLCGLPSCIDATLCLARACVARAAALASEPYPET
ncbi:aspartate/glutamate racemase family protein [Labrys monachus]|uniref:Aspartate racemase n=1 Tax=Labrys monachus TaxID=217067 RepID=A0ABU0FA91_9HYPH|nr:amino acid racemase [Labrys monachus]MDQ0391542.1 aspartate racemase [Labrys monachus]